MKKPYIVYSLSKGRTTQKFNKTKFKDILKDIDVFLQSFTMTNIQEPDKVELRAYTAYDEPIHLMFFLVLLKRQLNVLVYLFQNPFPIIIPVDNRTQQLNTHGRFQKTNYTKLLNTLLITALCQSQTLDHLNYFLLIISS